MKTLRRYLADVDAVLVGCVLILLVISLLMVSSASLSVSEVRYGDPFRIIGHWVIYMPVGLILMWWVSRIEPALWKAACLPALLLAMLAMVLVLAFGHRINGATRWFSLFGVSWQPVELLKPVMLMYMAYYVSHFPERLHQFATGLAPMLVVLGMAVGLLLLQPDFGNAILLTSVCFAIWLAGGVPVRHLVGTALTVIPLTMIGMVAEPYRMRRLTSFLDPWADPYDSGYQLIQSLLAFGSGGISGQGLGQGVQKLFYLPESFTDFIAAVIAEELGLGGTLLLIGVFGLLVLRGWQLSRQCDHAFERLLALSCTLMLGFSFMINMGAVMGLMPTKGIPIPFVSYGGSALLGDCVLVGLLLAIHRYHVLPGGNNRQKDVWARKMQRGTMTRQEIGV